MTDQIIRTASSARGLMVGAIFAIVVLAGAWATGVFDTGTSSDAPATAVHPPGSPAGAAADDLAALSAPPPAPPAATSPAPAPSAAAAQAPSPPTAPPATASARRPVWVDVPARTAATASGPLVIGLHGRGDTAANFARLAPRFPAGLAWRFLQASAPFSRGFAWFLRGPGGRAEGISASVAALHVQVRSAGAGRPVALFGFSQGCMLIVHYLIAHPEQIKAAVCIGGSVIGPLGTPAAGTVRPPVLFVNGAEDTVVPAQDTRAAMQALEAHGFPTEQIEHPGGHTVPSEEIGRIGAWLMRKVALP